MIISNSALSVLKNSLSKRQLFKSVNSCTPVSNVRNNSRTIAFGASNGDTFCFSGENQKYIITDDKMLIPAPTQAEIDELVSQMDEYDIWENLARENEAKQYFMHGKGEVFETSPEAIAMLKRLDNMDDSRKANFISVFCSDTGFPSLEKSSLRMEDEIKKGVHTLADKYNFDVKFIGYDCNCSVGRKSAFPGMDCDALFVIIDPPQDAGRWFDCERRWDFKDVVNQRIVSTPCNHMPEFFTEKQIEENLYHIQKLFEEANFTEKELARFEENVKDNSKDFVKSAEFDIRLAQRLPKDGNIREMLYKTAMLVELIRDGRVLENQFSPEFMQKVKNSPLYKYSNIMKQQGFKNIEKQKHAARREAVSRFEESSLEEKYQLIRDILSKSLRISDIKQKSLFENYSNNGTDEMGNILEMYDMLYNDVL